MNEGCSVLNRTAFFLLNENVCQEVVFRVDIYYDMEFTVLC